MPSARQKSSRSGHEQRWKRWSFRLRRVLHGCINWLVAGPEAQPPDIEDQLLRHSLAKTRTLVVSVVATSLMAFIAAVLTAATWAYVWLLAELLIGAIRLSLMSSLARAEAAGRNGNVVAPILAGLSAFVIVSAGACGSVVSGQWPLIAMAGMGIAILVGAVSSRNAGTPRFAFVLICILMAPLSLASLTSPIPNLFILGIQLPVYACGVIFVMLENYKVLLHLYSSERENRRLAHYDPLTGLPNRMMNLKRLDELLAELRAPSGQIHGGLEVFWLDLDGFKDVNDRHGHAAGDTLLTAVADRLRNCVRTLDFVSRIGGDEFVILLPAISRAEATAIAGRIIARVEAPFDLGLPAPVHVGISIGSACAPADSETADALLRSADRAMYEAKRRGKGLFVPYDTLEVEAVELAPAADTDARMAGIPGQSGNRNRHFPLPLHSKSL